MPARKFHVHSYQGHHTVYEIMPRHGERAVSPSYADKLAALAALQYLVENPETPRVRRSAS